MLNKAVSFLFLCMLSLISVNGLPVLSADKEIDQTQLPKILAEVAAYCRVFSGASLNYVCLEEVTQRIYRPYRKLPRASYDPLYTTQRHHFIYDYQLIQKDYDINEQRILIEENGIKTKIKDAPLKVDSFHYKHIILGPLLMDEYWQEFHDYRIIERDRLKKVPCFVIEAVPKSGTNKGDHLFGKFWISERDSKVWRIEWNQESVDNYEQIEETAEMLKARPQVKLILEMGVEEKGIHFPSQYAQRENYVNNQGALLIRSETTVNYKNYKFFTVETEVKIKKSPPPRGYLP